MRDLVVKMHEAINALYESVNCPFDPYDNQLLDLTYQEWSFKEGKLYMRTNDNSNNDVIYYPLESLLKYSNDEIIIIEVMSQDNTYEILILDKSMER